MRTSLAAIGSATKTKPATTSYQRSQLTCPKHPNNTPNGSTKRRKGSITINLDKEGVQTDGITVDRGGTGRMHQEGTSFFKLKTN